MPTTVRVSVGLEDFQDLKNDLIQAFDKVIRVSSAQWPVCQEAMCFTYLKLLVTSTNTIIVNYDWLVRTIQVYSRSSHGSTYSCFEDYISAGSQSNMIEARHLRYHCWILVCGRLGAPERISPALTKPFIKPKKKKPRFPMSHP